MTPVGPEITAGVPAAAAEADCAATEANTPKEIQVMPVMAGVVWFQCRVFAPVSTPSKLARIPLAESGLIGTVSWPLPRVVPPVTSGPPMP